MYDGNPADVPTIGTRAVLVSTSNQPNELVYAIVKAVFDNFATFRQLHPALSTLEIKDMVPSDRSFTTPLCDTAPLPRQLLRNVIHAVS
jgi:TRAP-type uncharacterized transport system substrate-binding protein